MGASRFMGRHCMASSGAMDCFAKRATPSTTPITALTAAQARRWVARQPKAARRDDARLAEVVRIAIRRSLFRAVGKKPVTRVEVLRVG